MQRIEKILVFLSHRANWVAAGALAGVMVLTVADVVLRLFRRPIPGAFEIVGMMGGVVVAFSLAYTSIEKGHISVDLIVDRLSPRVRSLVVGIYSAASALFFGVVSWQCVLYGWEFQRTGEVSASIRMPLHPFVYGTALGFLLLTLVLVMESARSFRDAGRAK